MNEDGHVSISRRGLLAAGLAVAAVGTIGVVSTMNASADDTPVVVAADPTQTPPKLLPSGQRPRPVVKGRTGASSAALAAAGASAATDVVSPESDATAFGPKGQSGVLTTGETDIAPPPLPPGLKEADPLPDNVKYFYGDSVQQAVTTGVSGMLTVATPTVGKEDWHSLAEFAVQSKDKNQVVEVGWTVDRTTFGDDQTHLFVYHWVNGKSTCYGCDFAPLEGATVGPGSVLPTGVPKFFGVMHSNGAWWIAYDTEYIGSFPDDLWKGNFTETGFVRAFGEVAASSDSPCTQMGNGKSPNTKNAAETGAAKFSSVSYTNGPDVSLELQPTQAKYSTVLLPDSKRSFRYGGPAAC